MDLGLARHGPMWVSRQGTGDQHDSPGLLHETASSARRTSLGGLDCARGLVSIDCASNLRTTCRPSSSDSVSVPRPSQRPQSLQRLSNTAPLWFPGPNMERAPTTRAVGVAMSSCALLMHRLWTCTTEARANGTWRTNGLQGRMDSSMDDRLSLGVRDQRIGGWCSV